MNSIVYVKLYSIFGYFFLINRLLWGKMITYFFIAQSLNSMEKNSLK